ncbi:MAG: hypothetical protein IJ019_00540 [Alphaproteobacteria bacterium]|nr:hypothetical protein [Alphaproteobacteria bacterium]
MIWFIILLIACASGLILSLRSRKDSTWQEDVRAELVYCLETQDDKDKWLAKFVIEDETFFVIVKTSKNHQINDEVDIQSADEIYDFVVYDEIKR